MRTATSSANVPRVLMAWVVLLLPSLAESSTVAVLRYAVRADPFEVELTLPDGTKETTRPEREATHFFFLAEDGWPIPEGADANRVRCEIRWNGFPTDWRLVNSFGIDGRTQEFQTTLGELRTAVFAGGDFRVARSKKGLLVVTRARWKFPDSEAVDLLDRIAGTQTAVWRDRGLRGHVLYLLATPASAGHWQGEARSRSTLLHASGENGRAGPRVRESR
jgi:hypothetical protein